jgi:tRNA A-37 threonylcarbamoyl transferase component Bud32
MERQCGVREALDRVLGRLRDGSASYFGVPDVQLRPSGRLLESEASIVLPVRIEGPGAGQEIFVKVFKPIGSVPDQIELTRKRVLNEFVTTQHVHRQMAALEGFSAVRPIACFPDELALVTERVSGETLGALLEREAGWWPPDSTSARLEQTLSRAGAWIRTFQATNTCHAFSLVEMREYLDVRLRRLLVMPRAQFPESWRVGVLRHFDARSRQINGADLSQVAIHADIAPGNMLVNGNEIIVIDFARATTGGKYHDVSRLYTQLEFMKCKPKFRASVIARLQAALLDGFERGLTPQHPLLELFLLQHTVLHLANLTGHPGSGPSRVYNWYQSREHRRWLSETCALPAA